MRIESDETPKAYFDEIIDDSASIRHGKCCFKYHVCLIYPGKAGYVYVSIRGVIKGNRPPKTYEDNFIHHDFLQFGKQCWRCKAILSSIVLHSSVVKHGRLKGEQGSTWILKFDIQLSYFLQIRERKMKFDHFWHPWKNLYGCPWNNPPVTPRNPSEAHVLLLSILYLSCSSEAVSKDLTTKYHWNHPPNFTGWIRPLGSMELCFWKTSDAWLALNNLLCNAN